MTATFADRLREAREKRGLSQSDLARRMSTHASTIAHFEAGRREPSFGNLRALAIALNCPTDYLLGTRNKTVTAFRNEDKLTTEQINFVQAVIDTIIRKARTND